MNPDWGKMDEYSEFVHGTQFIPRQYTKMLYYHYRRLAILAKELGYVRDLLYWDGLIGDILEEMEEGP